MTNTINKEVSIDRALHAKLYRSGVKEARSELDHLVGLAAVCTSAPCAVITLFDGEQLDITAQHGENRPDIDHLKAICHRIIDTRKGLVSNKTNQDCDSKSLHRGYYSDL